MEPEEPINNYHQRGNKQKGTQSIEMDYWEISCFLIAFVSVMHSLMHIQSPSHTQALTNTHRHIFAINTTHSHDASL